MKGVILMHGGGMGCLAFDVLVKKEHAEEFEWVKKELYRIDCEYVEEFLKENQDYIYLGSEDFQHSCDYGNIDILAKLTNEGFVVKCVG